MKLAERERIARVVLYTENVGSYTIYGEIGSQWKELVAVKDNVKKKMVHGISPVTTDKLKLVINSAKGGPIKVYELAVY